MANFLTLVRTLARESGIADPRAVITVNSDTETVANLAAWINEGAEAISLSNPSWPWLRKIATGSTLVGVANYSATYFGLSDFSAWPFSEGSLWIDGRELRPLTELDFDRKFPPGGPATTGVPIFYKLRGLNELVLGPTPSEAKPVTAYYMASYRKLTADTDIPDIPPNHHMAIVWRALMLAADANESASLRQTAQASYSKALDALRQQFMTNVQWR